MAESRRRPGARRVGADKVETLVFVGAVGIIAVLLVWWSVFANRMIDDREHLAEALARATVTAPAELDVELERQADIANRQRFMIVGEGSVLGAMLLVCVGALFLVARDARSASARLVRLLQFTTHELKTPIAGLRALLQSFQLGSIPDDARGRFLDQGLLECNRLEHLTETILAFQRAASQAKLNPVRMATAPLITDVLEHRKRTFGKDEVARAASSSHDIVVDKDAFRVVLENLLDNARKYGGNGGVELIESARDGRWRLDVKDHGEGFHPDDASRLFEPFERDTKKGVATHGSGLGLYISRQLVRDMGGELTASSEGPGKGAVFSIELPTAPEGSHG